MRKCGTGVKYGGRYTNRLNFNGLERFTGRQYSACNFLFIKHSEPSAAI